MRIPKNISFRKIYFPLCFAYIAMLLSCSDKSLEIGEYMVSPSSKMVYTDTCSVTLSTVAADSSVTNNTGVVYSGKYADSHLGTTTAIGYTCFNLTTFSSGGVLSTGGTYPVVFDSLLLTMKTEKRFYGDTIPPMTLHIHRLLELIEETEDNYGYIYNTTKIPYETEPIVSYTFKPKPRRTLPVEIRLPDEIGEDFLQKMKDEDDNFTTSEKFRHYFKGLALVPDPENSAIIGFRAADSTFMLQLYYHIITDTRTDFVISFPIIKGYQYNQYIFDRTDSDLENLNAADNELDAAETQYQSFAQGLAGVYSKIEFPYLYDITHTGKLSSIVKAELQLYPVRTAYDENTPLPSSISLYISDEENPVIAEGETVTGYLVKDTYNRRTHYSVAISSFLAEELSAIGVYKRNLQLVLPDTSLYRLIIGDSRYPDKDSRAKVNIQYMVYEPQE